MIINFKFRVGEFENRLYAIGDREAVLQAVCNIFANHGMPARETEQTFRYFPSGWIDRGMSAYTRASALFGGPESDCFSVKYSATSNPSVTMLLVKVYHKIKWYNESKAKSRIESFYKAFSYEFDRFQLPLIEAKDWRAAVEARPDLSCSPVW
jgi:hypothetical protein